MVEDSAREKIRRHDRLRELRRRGDDKQPVRAFHEIRTEINIESCVDSVRVGQLQRGQPYICVVDNCGVGWECRGAKELDIVVIARPTGVDPSSHLCQDNRLG